MLLSAVAERLPDDGAKTLDVMDVSMGHGDPQGSASHFLKLVEESDGTQRLFSLSGPWLDIMDNDRVVVIEKRAQLIATLHDVTLLNDVLDRGQIWLTQKDRHSEAALLKPLSDFRPRRKEALMRGYLGGRYGGVPVIIESDS